MTDANLHLFEGLFRDLFKPLCAFSMNYVKDWDDARNVVHEAFVVVWEKFETLPADTNYRSYLYTAVRNRSLNAIRDRKKNVGLEAISQHATEESNAVDVAELEEKIETGIQSLPEKCRLIFELNRRDGLKYGQIADQLGLSIKTVEAQMSKALAVMRVHLGEFLSILIFLLMN